MKILKYILFILLGLLAIYLVLCAMGPKKFELKRSMTMNASPEAVYEEVGDFSRWSTWSPWHQMDPNMKHTITGEAYEKGHMDVWQSEKVGNGQQKFVELRPNEYLKSEMKFTDFGDEPSYAEFIIAPKGDSTNVTWTMDGSEIAFMFRGMMVLMGATASMESDYDKGLSQIKALAEAKPKVKEVKMEYTIIDNPEAWYIGQRHEGVKPENINQEMYNKAYEAVYKNAGDKATGNPICVVKNVKMEGGTTMDLEISTRISAEVKPAEGLMTDKIPAGRAVRYVYKGDYTMEMGTAWENLMMQLAKDGLTPVWAQYEEYVKGPKDTTNPAEYETYLMVPIQ